MERERGIALALALIALVVVGALVAGTFFAGMQEQRIAESDRRLRRAFGLAEVAIGREIAGWDPGRHNGAAVRAIPEQPGGGGTYGGRVLRLSPSLFFIDVTARDSGGAAGPRQRVGLVVRIAPLEVDVRAALTAERGVRLTGDVRVDGTDQAPPGWAGCAAPDTARAGLHVNGPFTVSDGAAVQGSPAVISDSTLGAETLYDELGERATIRLPGGAHGSYPSPSGFQIVHIAGDATLSGGPGQGILLVDGDLTLEGSFQFFGVIIVRGRLEAFAGEAGDVRLWGGVLAREVELDLAGSTGRAAVRHSKCLIAQALQMSAKPLPLVSRGWGHLF